MFGHSNNKVLFSPICYHKIKVTTVIILHIMDGSRNFQNWEPQLDSVVPLGPNILH